MADILWCHPTEKQTSSVWYFCCEKCEVVRLGVVGKRVKIIEVKLPDGAVFQVVCEDGGFPGLAYEMLH